MKTLSAFFFASALLFLISGCKKGGSIEESTAAEVISNYLQTNPEYESIKLDIGEVKFRGRKDAVALGQYKELKEKGLIVMNLDQQKKRFLSKDSVYVYTVLLTDKSKPYVLKQDASKATIRALDYVLDEEKPVKLIKGDARIARVTVSLKKKANDFTVFLRAKGSPASFLTKTYKLKFRKEEGWILVGES
ncbi:hypothetical protein DBR11_15730 [Pedobacter sp. HMWF019]|uniref:hypothetical protein n=1 Tax=Pedobacter sp. HMWF019 TaxID=2056856 RepID=UPI000D3A4962|nr:hypothetical protein [Pedobacter sp. HMWF019]PTS98082.1 hypothetical protein DBR11_15730 [Pedobacter sp. HMWF019]